MTRYAMMGFAAAAIAWAVPDHATRSARQDQDWSWRGRVAAGRTLEVRSVNGSITAQRATGSEVSVTARKTGRDDDPAEVRIEVVEHEGGVTICAVYPGRRNRCAPGGGEMSVRDNDVTVDFTVHVPAGVRLEGVTVNGAAEAVGLDGPASLETVNGSVRVETSSGEASGRTVNGAVTAVVRGTGGTGPLRFRSVNGAITLSLPAGLNADLAAETVNGAITSDFPIQVQGRLSPRQLSGTIGQGGRRLELKNVNGSIRLQRIE